MQMTLPAGSSLTESIEVSRLAEKTLMDEFPEIKHVVAKIGTAEVPTDPMAVEDADVMIIMKPFKEWTSAESRAEMVEKMKEALEPLAERAEFNFSQPIQLRFNELMTGAKADIAVKLYGEDTHELYRKSSGSSRRNCRTNDGTSATGCQIQSQQDSTLRNQYRRTQHDHPDSVCRRVERCCL